MDATGRGRVAQHALDEVETDHAAVRLRAQGARNEAGPGADVEVEAALARVEELDELATPTDLPAHAEQSARPLVLAPERREEAFRLHVDGDPLAERHPRRC